MSQFDSSPLGLKYNQSKQTLVQLLNSVSDSDKVNLQTIINKHDELYIHSTNFANAGIKRITSAINCVAPSETATKTMNALTKSINDIINGSVLKDIFDAIEKLLTLTGEALSKAINALLNTITSAISTILDKIGALDAINELSSDVSKLLTSLTGMLSCSHDSLVKSNIDLSSAIGYVDPGKKVLLEHIRSESATGKSLSEIQKSSKNKIAEHLDVTSKMNDAMTKFGI